MVQQKDRQNKAFIEKVIAALISIATTGIVALCAFAFNVSATLARIEQKLVNDEVIRNDQQARINSVQLKVAEHEIAITRMETKQNIKPQ